MKSEEENKHTKNVKGIERKTANESSGIRQLFSCLFVAFIISYFVCYCFSNEKDKTFKCSLTQGEKETIKNTGERRNE